MFTGIIEATAEVQNRSDDALTIVRPTDFSDITIGSSIAINGVCLSIIYFDDRSMTFNVIPTTWQKSALGLLQSGDRVNLERAMRADGRFDGHIVQGHCEGVGEIIEISGDDDPIFSIQYNKNLNKFIIQEGSITLDGVSLTVAERFDDYSFSVALIPHTLTQTILGSWRVGSKVNIETDILGRYVVESRSEN